MYKTVDLSASELGPFHTLYLEHTGRITESPKKFSTVEAWAKANDVACAKTFGEYLDDPKSVAEDRLQAMVDASSTSFPTELSSLRE